MKHLGIPPGPLVGEALATCSSSGWSAGRSRKTRPWSCWTPGRRTATWGSDPGGPIPPHIHRLDWFRADTGSVGRNQTSIAARVRAAQNTDGGFGPRAGLPSEPEPTALATIALDDTGGRTWLGSHQISDGSVPIDAAIVVNDSATAFAAIAFEVGDGRDRALDHVEATQARSVGSTPAIPHDASVHGWAWTEETFGWVDPTARAVLALRLLRPDAPAIDDGVGLLRDRETVGGGWNYGNRVVFGGDLWPYAQTTASALIALQGADPELEQRGLSTLRRLWRDEREGGLSLAMSTVALRLHGDADADTSERALLDLFARTAFMDDVVTLAWSAIATGPSLASLEVTA